MSLMGKGDANRTRSAPGAGCARLGSPLGRRSPAGPSATAARMRWSLEETGRPAPTTRDRVRRWLAEPPAKLFNRQARYNRGQPLDMAGETLADLRRAFRVSFPQRSTSRTSPIRALLDT